MALRRGVRILSFLLPPFALFKEEKMRRMSLQ